MNKYLRCLLTGLFLALLLTTSHAAENVIRDTFDANTRAMSLLGVDDFVVDIYVGDVTRASDSGSYFYVRDSHGHELMYAQMDVFVQPNDFRIHIHMHGYSFTYGSKSSIPYMLSDGLPVDSPSDIDLYLVNSFQSVLRSVALTPDATQRKMNQKQRTFFDMVCYAAGACAFAPPASWACAPVAIGCLFTIPMATVETTPPPTSSGDSLLDDSMQPREQSVGNGSAGSSNGSGNPSGGCDSPSGWWMGGDADSGDIC